MTTIKGPAIYLAQFIGDEKPYDNLEGLCEWASGLGYKGIQLPTWIASVFDLRLASKSEEYCLECKDIIKRHHLELVEICSYLQGQMMAVPSSYAKLFQNFYPAGLDDRRRLEWATEQLLMTISASVFLGTRNISVLSGGFSWPFIYPWPQRPDGFIDDSFQELGRRWSPVLRKASLHGITISFELHPGGDLFDGVTFERLLKNVDCPDSAVITYDPSHMLLQNMDYLEFIKFYHDKIACFHVKDAEYLRSGKSGVYGGFLPWAERPGRFRSLGDGQVDFKSIFSLLTQYNYKGWAILEWECALKNAEQGASEGAEFINRHIIRTSNSSFDDFAKSNVGKTEYPDIFGYTV